MRWTRTHALTLLAVAAWNVVTYATFIRNLAATEDRPTGYYVAHTVLIVVNLVIAVVLGRWGWQAWRATRETPNPGRETSNPGRETSNPGRETSNPGREA